eukprot:251961-Amorphochlora_amoeboformis.AAC.1
MLYDRLYSPRTIASNLVSCVYANDVPCSRSYLSAGAVIAKAKVVVRQTDNRRAHKLDGAAQAREEALSPMPALWHIAGHKWSADSVV